MLVTSVTSTPAFCASCVFARFSSSIVIAKKRSQGTPSALFMAIRQLVLQGLPTTSTRISAAALAAIALPWPVKTFPLILSRSPRSIPALRGTEPTSSAQLTSLKPSSMSVVATTSLRRGNAQSSSSMTTPLSASRAGGISIRFSATGWSGPNMAPDAMRKRRA